MQSLPIIYRSDELNDRRFRLSLVSIRLPVYLLSFQRAHETFRHRIVPWTTGPAHGGLNTGPFEPADVIATGVLDALIGVMDQRARRYVTVANGHGQCRQRQFGPQMLRHRPADHAPAESIQHNRQVNERLA